MSDKFSFFAASIDQNIDEIDLHDTGNLHSALEKLESELFLLSKKDVDYAKVIHGIGSGILAKEVHKRLDLDPLIKSWKMEENGGSTIVLF